MAKFDNLTFKILKILKKIVWLIAHPIIEDITSSIPSNYLKEVLKKNTSI